LFNTQTHNGPIALSGPQKWPVKSNVTLTRMSSDNHTAACWQQTVCSACICNHLHHSVFV